MITVPVAVWSNAHMVLGRLNTGIMGSNPAVGIYVCPRFSVLCCVGRGHARADLPSKES
jgi:hypothetical protein